MKRLLILLFTLSHIIGKSQAKISIRPTYFISPNDTVNFGDSVQLSVFVKNTGNAIYSGAVTVQAKRDTAFGGACGSSTLAPAGLAPNDSVQTTLSFSPAFAGNFKVGGNGNTIVVWPYIVPGSGEIGDSLRLVLWISGFNGIPEVSKNELQVYPNPASNELTIKTTMQSEYKNIIICDVYGRIVKEFPMRDTVPLAELTSGSYWLILRGEKNIHRVPFVKE